MNIEKVNPVVIDSVEFYVSADGTESGMSISGLTRLLGINHQSFRRNFVSKLEGEGVELSELPNRLQSLSEKTFSLTLEGMNGARIIPSDACATIIAYYAYDSSHVSSEVKETAKLLHSKFAERGFHEFVKSSVGFIENKDNNQLLIALNELIHVTGQLKELQQFATEYKVQRSCI
jgi:hypothetical protein